MAHIEDRWYKTIVGPDGRSRQEPKPGHGKGMRYRVRYLDPNGRERSESFPDKKKREAQGFLATVQADILKGTYIDPDAGRVTFKQYADEWLAATTVDEVTHRRLEYQLRLHVYPHFGSTPLTAIQPTTLRAWARKIQESGLAASYRRVLFTDVSTVFNAAVDDRKVLANPFSAKSVRAPRSEPVKIVPWPIDQRVKVRQSIRDRYRIAVDLGAGCGLRQGEIFAVSPDDVDLSRRVLHIVRQIKIVKNRPIFAPPKGGKTRDVPLPESVLRRLDAHAKRFPPIPVTLPWANSSGEPRTVNLYLYTANLEPVKRSGFNASVWKPAILASGIEDTRQNGMHVLRHTYASILLDAGESVKALAAYLGHANPGFTLRVYTHLLPNSEDRTRRAIDRAFEDGSEPRDGLDTA